MMKQFQDSNPPPPPQPQQQHPTVCGQCGIEEKKLLHNVRLRGNFRRLCTNCVLRLHPQCFCPSCLGVFEKTPPENAVVCFKCYSSSHPNCVISQPLGGNARGPVPCSVCLNPGSLVLNLNVGNKGRGIDGNAARLLLAAGKIAAMSMSKAEVAAAMEAERRAKEAAFTKKRAREALDHVVKMMVKEKSSGNVAKKKVGVVVKEKVDGSNEVVEALNAVELKESGRAAGVGGINNNNNNTKNKNNSNGKNKDSGVVVMDVDVVNGKVSGVSVVENGSVKMDGSGKVVNDEKVGNGGEEQGLGKVNPMGGSNVVSGPKQVS
uniref:uncharacterized protein LOC122600338 n=1 Tax=Erigeron canadensis TaxID=72917 RepID=UPI001CB9AC8D|nr:uncharacterized protein LOC122600338 [Erigeron canadensis]